MPDRWEIIRDHHGAPLLADILMIHTALLPSGKVLGTAGSEHDQGRTGGYRSVLWDPADPHHLTTVPAPGKDLFCAGHAMLADGNVLFAGGTADYDRTPDNPHRPYHFTGIADCFIFDWRTETWRTTAPMKHARWYPTLLTLSDGRVLAISGHGGPDLAGHEILETEIYDPATGAWAPSRLTDPELMDTGRCWFVNAMVYYTRMHVLADGRAFSSTALRQKGGARRTRILDPETNVLATAGPAPRGSWVPFMSHVYARANFTSVLLPLRPPDYPQSVLIAGGRRAYRFDLCDGKGRWRRAGARRPYRMRAYGTAVLLPDGSVLNVGGGRSEKIGRFYWPWSEHGGYDRDANPVPERYLPERDAWVEGSVPQYPPIPRMYHSVAQVLPDGRVLVAGSNRDSQRNVGGVRTDHGHHGEDARELRLELYSPGYLFDADGRPARRIEFSVDPDTAGYGEEVRLRSPEAGRIHRVTLLRCGSVTHAYNSDQRLLELAVVGRSAREVTVLLPPTPQLAVPGYYLLFPLDVDGVPGVGARLRVG